MVYIFFYIIYPIYIYILGIYIYKLRRIYICGENIYIYIRWYLKKCPSLQIFDIYDIFQLLCDNRRYCLGVINCHTIDTRSQDNLPTQLQRKSTSKLQISDTLLLLPNEKFQPHWNGRRYYGMNIFLMKSSWYFLHSKTSLPQKKKIGDQSSNSGHPIVYTLFEILLNQTEIRLYLTFSDWFGTVNGHCPFAVPNQSKNGKYNLISVWLKRFGKDFSVCLSYSRALTHFHMNFEKDRSLSLIFCQNTCANLII